MLPPWQEGEAPILWLRDKDHMSVLGKMLLFGTTECSVFKVIFQ